MNAGNAQFDQGDYATAGARYRDALEEAQRQGSGDPRVAKSLDALAAAYRSLGLFAEPNRSTLRAIDILCARPLARRASRSRRT